MRASPRHIEENENQSGVVVDGAPLRQARGAVTSERVELAYRSGLLDQ
jgi:hypothetical protein